MIAISSLLSRERILLEGEGIVSPETAVTAVVELLRKNPHVISWEKLAAGLSVGEKAPCAALRGCEFAVCIPHVRTDAVSGMVMGMGRFAAGIQFEGCPVPVRYIFCIGLPPAMNADYLAVVGLLTRFLRISGREEELRRAESPERILEILVRFQAGI
jgi:mannitol/fructose-specific phosphotransferase system IIA component (Ntr-type)